MRNIGVQWKAIQEKKAKDLPEKPKITKALPVLKWIDPFLDVMRHLWS